MITNNHGLPDAFVNYARSDKYSKGDSDISVTQLIDSPRILLMRERHKEELTTDAMDMVWALFGTAVHAVLEGAVGENVVKEKRLYRDVDGWVLSGQVDQYEIKDNALRITDYKVTSVWSVIFNKQEWVNQLNVYAYLLEMEEQIPVNSIQICAILRDWSRREASLRPDYPQTPIAIVDIPLWSLEERTAYVEDRIALHQNARQLFDLNDGMVLCTKDEMWSKPDVYAVKKPSNKKAKKRFEDRENAEQFLDNLKDKHLYEIEFRAGESARCKNNYCGVADFCNQYKETINE
tara:strand:+ start:1283 stop:2158 length:876 start_codon:yes stop_codon:yes gene_type:complete